MPTLSDAYAGLEILRALLQDAFSNEYHASLAAQQTKFSGVDVLAFDTKGEQLQQERSGRPYLGLVLVDGGEAEEWGHDFRMAVVEVDAVAEESNGGKAGAANVPIQRLVSERLLAMVRERYEVFNALGLQGIMITGPAQITIPAAENRPLQYVARHRITFYFRAA